MDPDLEAKKAAFMRKKKAEIAAKMKKEAPPVVEKVPEEVEEDTSSQDEIDRMMAEMAQGGAAAAVEPEPEPEEEEDDTSSQDEIDRMMAEMAGGGSSEADEAEDDALDEDDFDEEAAMMAALLEDEGVASQEKVPEESEDDVEDAAEEDVEDEPDALCVEEEEECVEDEPVVEAAIAPVPVQMSIPVGSSPKTIEGILTALAAGQLIDETEDREVIRQRKIDGVVKKMEVLIEQAAASIPPDCLSKEDVALAVRRMIGRLCEKYGLFG